MFIKSTYEPVELLAMQELDEVLKALKLSDEDVIELLLDNINLHKQNLIQEWYNNFQQDYARTEAEDKYEDRRYE